MALFGAKQPSAKKPAAKKAEGKVAETKEVKKAPEVAGEQSMQELYASDSVKKTSSKKKSAPTTRYEGAYRVLAKPLITEKATELGALNKYAFVITPNANKIEVAKAVQAIYGVTPVRVNIIAMKGKVVTRGRIRGQRKDWKKVIVTLKKGETIKIYEGV
ncbi:MAG: 50S ribosomal protein L23 [bacterium]|nr:50S ribosomal protein L23 [bacterium]